MALTDREIWESGYKYVPNQEYLLNPFRTPTTTDDDDETTPGSGTGSGTGINMGHEEEFEGGTPPGLEQTWTREREPENVLTNTFDNTGVDELNQKIYDKMAADADIFQTGTSKFPGEPGYGKAPGYMNKDLWTGLNKNSQEDFMAQYPEYFSQGRVPETGILQSLKNKFFQPGYRRELGNRLYSQYQRGQKLPSFLAGIARAQSPFNSESKNYNKNFVDQLNYLEGLDGYIGRDGRSGHLRYGPKSVLSGQNVISGFGSNNYDTQLAKKREWFEARKDAGKSYSKKNYQQTKDEIKAWNNSPDNPKNKNKQIVETQETDGDNTGGDNIGYDEPTSGSDGEFGPGSWMIADGGMVKDAPRRFFNGGLASVLNQRSFRNGTGRDAPKFLKGADKENWLAGYTALPLNEFLINPFEETARAGDPPDGGTTPPDGGGGGGGSGSGHEEEFEGGTPPGNGDEPPVGGYPGSEDEWGDLSDPDNPLYEPPTVPDYGFDIDGNFIGEGDPNWGPDPDYGFDEDENFIGEGPGGDPGPEHDDWGGDWGFYNRGGRVYLNLGGLASILTGDPTPREIEAYSKGIYKNDPSGSGEFNWELSNNNYGGRSSVMDRIGSAYGGPIDFYRYGRR